MSVRFVPRVRHGNDLLLPRGLYPPFEVPPGITVRAPQIVTVEEMQRLVTNTSSHTELSIVGGLTKPEFSVHFEDFDRQWRQAPHPRARPASPQDVPWQFQGGAIFLDLLLTVYVTGTYAEYPPQFSLIMEHELLHVFDEIDIVTQYIPSRLVSDSQVRLFLENTNNRAPATVYEDFRSRRWAQRVYNNLWVPEHNRRARSRDSGPEWEAYQRRFQELSLRRQQGR